MLSRTLIAVARDEFFVGLFVSLDGCSVGLLTAKENFIFSRGVWRKWNGRMRVRKEANLVCFLYACRGSRVVELFGSFVIANI